MENLFLKIKAFFGLYKWMLLLSIPAIIFLFLVINLLRPSGSPTREENMLPTITPVSDAPQQQTYDQGEEYYEDFETYPNFQSKETASNGTVTYTFSSNNPSRPNIEIIAEDGRFIFSRTLNSTELPIATIPQLVEALGEPERVVQGSKFYGQNANIYIYASQGLALIANSNTGEVFEEQYFQKTSVDAYLQRFVDQN